MADAIRRPAVTSHIWLDERGRAWIGDTNVKVIEVILDKLANRWEAEAIQLQHPHLSLAQIHAALSYYFDHQDALDAEIEQQLRELDRLREAQEESAIKVRLREAGLLQ
jgi:uncharacterized protein (DUF433 family)